MALGSPETTPAVKLLMTMALIGLAGCAPHCASVQYVALPDGVTTTYIKTGCLAPTKAVYARLPDGSVHDLYGFDSANPAAPIFGYAESLIP